MVWFLAAIICQSNRMYRKLLGNLLPLAVSRIESRSPSNPFAANGA
jgi:hypothetical protein